MRRLSISIEIAFGEDEPEEVEPDEPQHDTALDAYVETTGNEPDPRAPLDSRRPMIGFAR